MSRSVLRVVRIAVAVLALTLLAVEHRPAVGRRGRRAGPARPGVVRVVPRAALVGLCSRASPGAPCWPTSAARCRSRRPCGCSSWPRSASTFPVRSGRSSRRWSSAGRSGCLGSRSAAAACCSPGCTARPGCWSPRHAAVRRPEAAEDYWWVLALTPVLLVVLHPRVLSPLLDRAFWLLRRPPLDRPLTLAQHRAGLRLPAGDLVLLRAVPAGAGPAARAVRPRLARPGHRGVRAGLVGRRDGARAGAGRHRRAGGGARRGAAAGAAGRRGHRGRGRVPGRADARRRDLGGGGRGRAARLDAPSRAGRGGPTTRPRRGGSWPARGPDAAG